MAGEWLQSDNAGRIFRLQIVLFLFTLTVFLAAPVIQASDSRYTILLSECLLHHHTFALDTYSVPQPSVPEFPLVVKEAGVYQLVRARSHTTYYYPQAGSILSIPFVAVANAFGLSAATPAGKFNFRGEVIIERIVASLLMAALTCVIFHTALMMLPIGWSIVVALGAALGTQILSTASRGLWSHTWQILVLGILVDALLSREHRGTRAHPIWIATLVAWAYFARPTGSITIVTVSMYVLFFLRPHFLVYGATLGAWLAGFVLYSLAVFGTRLPPYYFANRFNFDEVATAFFGNLASPSRGLFVYVPTVMFAIYLVARYWRRVEHRRLAILGFANIGAHAIVLSVHQGWWGGLCYGARLFSDVMPWFVLIAILGLDAMRRTIDVRGRRMELAAGFFLLAISVAINARGAWSFAGMDWNDQHPGQHPTNLFDWRYPQFMAGLIDPPKN
jgi:hypothetical protein